MCSPAWRASWQKPIAWRSRGTTSAKRNSSTSWSAPMWRASSCCRSQARRWTSSKDATDWLDEQAHRPVEAVALLHHHRAARQDPAIDVADEAVLLRDRHQLGRAQQAPAGIAHAQQDMELLLRRAAQRGDRLEQELEAVVAHGVADRAQQRVGLVLHRRGLGLGIDPDLALGTAARLRGGALGGVEHGAGIGPAVREGGDADAHTQRQRLVADLEQLLVEARADLLAEARQFLLGPARAQGEEAAVAVARGEIGAADEPGEQRAALADQRVEGRQADAFADGLGAVDDQEQGAAEVGRVLVAGQGLGDALDEVAALVQAGGRVARVVRLHPPVDRARAPHAVGHG